MVQSVSDTVRAGFSGNIGRAGRYLMVSAVNVLNHQIILQLAIRLGGWSGGWANAFAATVAAIPAYFMSRYWVWQVRGRSSMRSEVLPFWGIALLGLVVSSLTAEIADRMFDQPLMVSVGSLFGYVVVWIAKFLLLDRLFGTSGAEESPESGGLAGPIAGE